MTPREEERGWIPWSGGDCPVDPLDRIEIRFRSLLPNSEGPTFTVIAHTLSGGWQHEGGGGDIVAYRHLNQDAGR